MKHIINCALILLGVLISGCGESSGVTTVSTVNDRTYEYKNGSKCTINYLGRIDRCENHEAICYKYYESLQCKFKSDTK